MISKHIYKKAARKEADPWKPKVWPGYTPAKLVREYGDWWIRSAMSHLPDVSTATVLALSERTQDQREAFLMTLMERGVVPRVHDCYEEPPGDSRVVG